MRASAKLSWGAVVLLLLGSACADPPAEPAGPSTGSDQTRYQGDVFVLDEPDREPVMCLGGVAESLPPQCAGIPIVGWDWSAVEGEETASNTTWGSFHVVGTYDGESFTVQEVGVYQPPTSDSIDFTPPCPEPAGGWAVMDPARVSEADLQAVMLAAEGEPDSAGFWIDYLDERSETTRPERVIAIAAFTGDLERHETELREEWGGALCVTELERTQAELQRIQRELGGGVGESLGLQTTWSQGNVVDNRVEVGVVVADAQAVAAVEERYGAGAVLLVPALEPVEQV